MKYARDRKITSSHTAEVLIEAFPWIKNATGKTILIKYGGAAMVDPELRNAVMSEIVMLKTRTWTNSALMSSLKMASA